MATEKRWTKAQKYERSHWDRVAQELASDERSLEWYNWRANRMTALLSQYVPALNLADAAVLEVGSGPVGTVSFLKARERHAIDPLSSFYEQKPALIQLRDRQVTYLTGGGESLPFEDGKFSLVIIDNVIDHTKSPETVLREIRRVLRPGSVLYLSVNVRTNWGLCVRRAMEVFEVDPGHPHSYSRETARRMIERAEFEILHEEMEHFETARKKEREAGHLRNRIKLLLGVYDVLYEAFARRQ